MEFSKLIGKRVLSAEGETLGYVLRTYLSNDLTALACLACADPEEEEFFLAAESVQKIGDVILADNAPLSVPNGVPCPVGKAVYDEQGSFLGIASALTSGTNGVLTVVGQLGEKEYAARRIIAQETVIVRSKINNGVKKEPKKPLTETPREEKKKSDSITLPDTIYRMNLLGKTLKTSLAGLAQSGEPVTAEMIKRAHESNRLLELTAAILQGN